MHLSNKKVNRQYWSGQSFPSPGDLPNPGIKLGSPVLQADSLLTELSGKPPIQKQNLHSQMSLKHMKTIKAQKTQEEPVTIPTTP